MRFEVAVGLGVKSADCEDLVEYAFFKMLRENLVSSMPSNSGRSPYRNICTFAACPIFAECGCFVRVLLIRKMQSLPALFLTPKAKSLVDSEEALIAVVSHSLEKQVAANDTVSRNVRGNLDVFFDDIWVRKVKICFTFASAGRYDFGKNNDLPLGDTSFNVDWGLCT